MIKEKFIKKKSRNPSKIKFFKKKKIKAKQSSNTKIY
jgi:hypothetical protein